MESSWTVLSFLVAVWLIAFSAQLADFATARFDHLRLARGVRTRVRLHPVAWVVPVAGLAFVVTAVGIDWSARMFFAEQTQFPAAVLIALSTVAIAVAVVAIIAVVVVRPPADSYRLMRDELIELAGVRMHQDQVDEFHARVSAIDAASKERRMPDSVTVPATLQLILRTPHWLIAPVVSLAVAISAIVEVVSDSSRLWMLALALLTLVISVSFAIAAARASMVLRAAVRSTQDVYRGELVGLLFEAERSSKKRVAGLGDRVARALSILREQQAAQ
ncbi:hypothetical protein A20C1_01186 [marine actinobacterium PHSC20C1]|nr:hypothetical protein A20C1_01186 [marine actinobacterium PHSC20C1]